MNTVKKSDANLVNEILNGNVEKFSCLIDRYEKLVFSFLLAKKWGCADIEDIVQETFLKAFKHLKNYDPKRKFSNWLLTIAKNLLIDKVRRERKKVNKIEFDADFLQFDMTKSNQLQPSEILERKERLREITENIHKLAEEIRTPFLMRIMNDLSYQQIAKNLDLPLQTVKNRIFKARKILRSQREN